MYLWPRSWTIQEQRVRLVSLSNRALPHPDGLRACARGGRGAGTRATPGTPGTPRGAKQRGRLHLRGVGRRLRRAARVRGHRRVAGLQGGPDQPLASLASAYEPYSGGTRPFSMLLCTEVRGRVILRSWTPVLRSSRKSGCVGRYRRRGCGYSFGTSCKRSGRSIPVTEQEGSFWDTLIGGTGEGPEAQRKEKVLRYIVHRLKSEASLREVLQEEYVRRNCTQPEI